MGLEHGSAPRRPFRPWPWFVAWLATGALVCVIIGGSARAAFGACFATGATVLGFYLWRAGRTPSRTRPVYVADHRPTLVIRVDPPVLTPRWWAALFVVEPWVRLVGADGTWQVNGLKWGQTFTVDAPPGAFTLKFWFAHTLPTARLDVVLNVDGTLYVTWEAPWWPVFRGRIRWQPRVPDGVAVDGHLLVEKVPDRWWRRTKSSGEAATSASVMGAPAPDDDTADSP
jgi:hypothetical protein